jgi:phosphatidylglycerophosphatase A
MNGSQPLPSPPGSRPNCRFMVARLSHLVALGFGCGLARVAPGTVGTLGAWLSYLVLARWFGNAQWAVLIAASFAIGVWASTRTAADMKSADPGAIVWDEIVAFWLVLWLAGGDLATQAACFALFRFFDIVKPPPIRQLERRVAGGLGVMLDDLLAALYALLVLAAWRVL